MTVPKRHESLGAKIAAKDKRQAAPFWRIWLPCAWPYRYMRSISI